MRAPPVCRRTVSGTFSLPCQGCFSPFPHGTGSLSVSREYLALADGPAGFGQGFTCPALLRVLPSESCLRVRGFHPLWRRFPDGLHFASLGSWQPYNPAGAGTPAVWAVPASLAATKGITFVFFSSGYLDVSVLRVGLHIGCHAFSMAGCPIRRSTGQGPFAPYRGLSQLVTSFIASGSPGIRRTPLFASLQSYIASSYSFSLACRVNELLCPLLCICFHIQGRVEDIGVEPMTPCVQGRCSEPTELIPLKSVNIYTGVVPPRLELGTSTLSV